MENYSDNNLVSHCIDNKVAKHGIFNQCNIYVALWLLYDLQQPLGVQDSALFKLLVIILVLWSFYHMVYCLQHFFKTNYIRGLTFFIIIISLYGLLYMLFPSFGASLKGTSRNLFLKTFYISVIPIFSFFYFTKKKYISEKYILYIVPVLLLSYFILYSFNQRISQDIELLEENTNNFSYRFVGILPLLVLFKNKKYLQMFLVMICFYFILEGMKRGAMLLGFLMLMYFSLQLIKNTHGSKRLLAFVLVLGGTALAIYLVVRQLATSDYFAARIAATQMGDASNRESFYPLLLKSFFYDSSIFQQFFGKGPYYTIKVVGNYAHNDWLEIGTDLGILGILVYINYYRCLWKDIRKSRYIPDVKIMLILTMTYILGKSFFSMSYDNLTIANSLCLGYCMALLSIINSNNHHIKHYKFNNE